MFRSGETSETSFPDNGILYQTSTTASTPFQKAKNAFLSFLISFFSKFVINKLRFYTYHDKNHFDFSTTSTIEILFFDNYFGKPYFFDMSSEDCSEDDKHLSNFLSRKIARSMLNTLEKFTRRGYKSNGKRVFLHPDFLAKYLWEFFNLFNPDFESNLNIHDSSQKVSLYKRSHDNKETFWYNKYDITFELDDKRKSSVYHRIEKILTSIDFSQYLLSEKPHEVTKEQMILRRRFLDSINSGRMFDLFNSNYEMFRDAYIICSEDIFQRDSLKYAMKARFCLNPNARFSLIPDSYQNMSVISFLQKKLETKSFETYHLIEQLMDPKRFARTKILPLLEQNVFDTWYGEEVSKKVDSKDKQVLPQEIRNIIISYI